MTKPDDAKDFYDQVSKVCNMLLDRDTGRALDILETLQRQRPGAAEVMYLMGLAAVTMEEYGRGLILIEEAHNRDPDCYEYAEVLANLHVRVGKLTEGVYFAKLSTTLEPHPYVGNLIPSDLSNFFDSLDNASIPRHMATGFAAFHKHEYDVAMREFDRHVLLSPNDPAGLSYCAATHLAVGNIDTAIAQIRKALAIEPESGEIQFRAGQIAARAGAVEAAATHFGKAIELEKDNISRPAAALAIAGTLNGISNETLSKMSADVACRTADAQKLPAEAQPSRDRKDRIHVCYVTNGGWHPDIAAVLDPILELHDRSKFEVFLYQQAYGRSAFIQQLNTAADLERRLWELDDETAAIVISGDEIDILVNMCVPDIDNRASLMVMQPAVIQAGFIGQNFGLHMPGITHVLSDPMTHDAISARMGAGQKVEQVRPGLWGLRPPSMLPEVSKAPAMANGYLTIGAPCELEILDKATVEVMAETLRAVPTAKLLFGAVGARDGFARRQIAELFSGSGVGDRVSIWPDEGLGEKWIPNPDFWQQIDLFLAIGPITAPLRVAEALWMGVPAYTVQGTTPAACAPASILASAAKLDWSFKSGKDLATAVKADADDLAAVDKRREGLRDDMRKTALFNPVIHVRELEQIYLRLVDARDALF